MLLLGRRHNESVTIYTSDGPIVVTLVESRNGTRIGIDAPRSVRIVRTELIEQKPAMETENVGIPKTS